MSPHPPYIFTASGELPLVKGLDENSSYRDQVIAVNSLALHTINQIITRSDSAPIIILQSDHGVKINYEGKDSAEELPILNAYLLPQADTDKLYSSISPVNTFRLIFNNYFSYKFELLPDVSLLESGRKSPQLACK